MALLELTDLHVSLEDGTEIVKGVDLAVSPGEIHALMGPNGSGKSSLAYALMGHPAYEITGGEALFDGQDLTELGADERAQLGLFLAFALPGGSCSSTTEETADGRVIVSSEVCEGFVLPAWLGIPLLVVLFVAPVAVAAVLYSRAVRRVASWS